MAETILQNPGSWLPWHRGRVEEFDDRHEHLCFRYHPGDVLGAYDCVLGLCDGVSSGLAFHGLWSLFRDRGVAFRHGSGRDRIVPALFHDEALQVFPTKGTIQYDRHADAAGLDGLGLFLLQRLSRTLVWRGRLGESRAGVYRGRSPMVSLVHYAIL